MSKEGSFLIHCIEQYKAAKQLTGRQVIALFEQFSVMEYIYDCFEALHTTGRNYLINDIDQYIAAQK